MAAFALQIPFYPKSKNRKLTIFSPPVSHVACNRWLGTLRFVVTHKIEKGNMVVL
jgi:hypothetical protein